MDAEQLILLNGHVSGTRLDEFKPPPTSGLTTLVMLDSQVSEPVSSSVKWGGKTAPKILVRSK